jgi:ABC-2 type transport system permease protein
MMTIMRNFLKQSWAIINLAWQRNFTYRALIVSYRAGEIIEILVLVLMWSAIYSNTEGGVIRGFTLNEMISYVLIGNLCGALTRNFLAGYVGRHIHHGQLSSYLIRPISYIKFVFINELGRAFMATFISAVTQIIVILFFLDKIVINKDFLYIGLVVVMVILAFVIEMLLGFIIGTIAFWVDEVDGIHMTVERVKRFFSGGYFPLSLLPASIVSVSTFLPFGYSFFVPASLYLKKMSLNDGLLGLAVQVVWIILLSIILTIVWRRGLKRYEAVGS